MNRSLSQGPIVVAGIELQAIEVHGQDSSASAHCSIRVSNKFGKTHRFEGVGDNLARAMAATLQNLARLPFVVASAEQQASDDRLSICSVIVRAEHENQILTGFGKSIAESDELGILTAILKAMSHAGILRAEFAANNQKHLKKLVEDQAGELLRAISTDTPDDRKRLELESMLLDYSNRIAASAVISATNAAEEDAVLYMYDTSAWLYDSKGRRRSECLDTNLWLAWYPGLECKDLTVAEVLESLPKVESKNLPWIVRALENPESWLRFRGAISLADHDILHVLLGRGLQDQDEAFVLGFAMGTARRYSYLQHRVFRWLLSKVYPEPYRIPKFLLPAFDLGIECGRQTGRRDLYRESLGHLKNMTVEQARKECEIDVDLLRKLYREERKRIPFTVASIRLP